MQLLWVLVAAYGIQFPDQVSNPGPLRRENGPLGHRGSPPPKPLLIYRFPPFKMVYLLKKLSHSSYLVDFVTRP